MRFIAVRISLMVLILLIGFKEGKKDYNNTNSGTKEVFDTVTVSIIDENNDILRTIKHVPDSGINRLEWKMDMKGVRYPNKIAPRVYKEESGPSVLPGKYKVYIVYKDYKDSTDVIVESDPRNDISIEDMRDRLNNQKTLLKTIELVTSATDKLREAKNALENSKKYISSIEDTTLLRKMKEESKDILKSIEKIMLMVVAPEDAKGYIYRDDFLNYKLQILSWYLYSDISKVTLNEAKALQDAQEEVKVFLEKVNLFIEEEWNTFKGRFDELDISLIKSYSPIK